MNKFGLALVLFFVSRPGLALQTMYPIDHRFPRCEVDDFAASIVKVHLFSGQMIQVYDDGVQLPDGTCLRYNSNEPTLLLKNANAYCDSAKSFTSERRGDSSDYMIFCIAK